jgi:uncharacterized membrane protein YecN with MAPEG domain
MVPTATILYAGLLGLIALALAVNVSRVRNEVRIVVGDGGNTKLLQAIRAHGALVEYVPLCLIMIGLLEFAHAPRWLVHGLGILLVIARILHAQGLLSDNPGDALGRKTGAGLQYLILLVAAVACTYYGVIWRAI